MKNILPILADVANGVFATVLAGLITGVDPGWHVAVGVLFAMSPDIDALPELIKRGKVSAMSEHNYDHREGLHYPILFLLIGIVFVYTPPFWG